MNYWATDDDQHFSVGHYVEDWELRRVEAASLPVKELLRLEGRHGNKLKRVAERYFEFAQPICTGVLELPDGLAFFTPIQHGGVRVLDGDEVGVVICLASHARIYPSGYERDDDHPPELPSS